MKNCVECNKSLEDDAKYCSNCKAKQPERKVEPEVVQMPKKANFAIYKNKKGEFRFRLKAANGEILATSECCPTKAAVMNGIKLMQKNAPIAEIEDCTEEKVVKKSDFQEKKQAIYEMTAQDNCGECECANCMSFAMQAASPKNSMELSDCSYIDEDEAEEFYNQFLDETDNSLSISTLKKAVAKHGIMDDPELDKFAGVAFAPSIRAIAGFQKLMGRGVAESQNKPSVVKPKKKK